MSWLRNLIIIIGALPALLFMAAVEFVAAKTVGIAKFPQDLVGYASFVFGIFICAFLIWTVIL
jgi:hypothetical protein